MPPRRQWRCRQRPGVDIAVGEQRLGADTGVLRRQRGVTAGTDATSHLQRLRCVQAEVFTRRGIGQLHIRLAGADGHMPARAQVARDADAVLCVQRQITPGEQGLGRDLAGRGGDRDIATGLHVLHLGMGLALQADRAIGGHILRVDAALAAGQRDIAIGAYLAAQLQLVCRGNVDGALAQHRACHVDVVALDADVVALQPLRGAEIALRAPVL